MYNYIPEYDLVRYFPQNSLTFEDIAEFIDYLAFDLKKNPLNRFISLEKVSTIQLTEQENYLIPELRKQLKPSQQTVRIVIFAPSSEARKLLYYYQLHNAYDNYRIICTETREQAARYLSVPEEILTLKSHYAAYA